MKCSECFLNFIFISFQAKLVELTGASGVVTSLMYPNYVYYTIGAYKWRITVDPDSVIRVTINNCILKRDSHIQIYDGYDSSSGVLQSIETDNIPTNSILSSTNVLLIEFEIPTFSESKYKLEWNKVPKASVATNVTNNNLNCTSNSVITVTETDRLVLQSPGFPDGYGIGSNCLWKFLPSRMGYHVGIQFTTIDLESTSNCIADYVRVEMGSDDIEYQQGPRLCSSSQLMRSSRYHGSPNLKVQFVSDFSNNRTGFAAIVMLDCGGSIEGPQGQITNEMAVSNRSQLWMNETCTWKINVARGRTIQFNFDKLNLMRNDDGTCNSYIIIRNGIHEDSPFLGSGKYCSDLSKIPKTSSNKAIVQFVQNRSFRRTNEFVLKYQQIEHECGGTFSLHLTNSTIITSPNYRKQSKKHVFLSISNGYFVLVGQQIFRTRT